MADKEVFNIRPFLTFRCFFGYYHNIINSGNRVKYLLKSVSLIIVLIICYLRLLCKVRSNGILGLSVTTIQYIFNIICSLYTEDEYILEYFEYDPLIDDKRKKKLYTKLKIILIVYVVVVIISQTSYYGSYGLAPTYNLCGEPWQFHFMGTMRLAMSFGRLPVLAVFGLFYCRVNIFCRKIRHQILKNIDTFSYKKHMRIYERIRTTFHKTDFPIKLLMFIHLGMVFLDITNVQYRMVTQFTIPTLISSTLHLLSSLFVFFPCLIMELISEETENMRIFVADRMIICANENQRDECRLFLYWIRQRPMTYVIWRAFKMDFRFLLSYLSLVVTYLVCILQFKPIYTNIPATANSTAQ